jgi:hypothetical protein
MNFASCGYSELVSSSERETLVVQQGLNREIFGTKRVHCCSKMTLILPARLDVWIAPGDYDHFERSGLPGMHTLAAIHSNKER